MSRPPSHPPPSSGYSRSNSHPYQPPPPGHHHSQQYSHPPPGGNSYSQNNPMPPVDRDPYQRHPHPGDQYYYSQPQQPPHQSYQPAPEYRGQRLLRPPPHPPAPPVPPPSARKQYPPQGGPTSPRPNLVPTFNYYRSHAEYDTQHTSEAHGGTRGRSGSTGSGYGSGLHEGEMEATPSPIDPRRIQQWEDEHAHGTSHHVSSGSGSYHGEDEDEDDTLRQPLGDHHGYHSSTSFGHGGHVDPGSANLDMPYSQKRTNSDYYPSPHHQAQFQALAQQTGPVNTQRGSIGLNSLVDGEPGDRPAYPIPTIIKCAILGSPHQQLTLSELYLAMEMRFDYYKNSDKKSWRNSVRHNLSLNNQFDKKERPITEPGKGHYWVVVPDMPQGNKRERKRNKKPGKRALAAMAAEAERLEQEQHVVGDPMGSRMNSSQMDMPLEHHISSTTAVYPAAVRGYTTGTLPANAGSYAAVTGALPAPPPLDRQLFRPWSGDASSSHQDNSRYRPAPTDHRDSGPRSPMDGAPDRRPTQPQFGESSLRPTGFSSTGRRPDGMAIRHSDSFSTESSSSASGLRSPGTRTRHRYDPTGPIPTGPQNAFSELAAQIQRDGLVGTGSGGPALAARGKRRKGKGRDMDDEWDSDEDASDDDEYLPRKSQSRRR